MNGSRRQVAAEETPITSQDKGSGAPWTTGIARVPAECGVDSSSASVSPCACMICAAFIFLLPEFHYL